MIRENGKYVRESRIESGKGNAREDNKRKWNVIRENGKYMRVKFEMKRERIGAGRVEQKER